MVQTYKDADGNDVEAVPISEFQQTQQELETLRKEKEDLATEKARLEAGHQDKDSNLAAFRTKIEGTEKALGDVTKKLADKEEHERTTAKTELKTHYAGADEASQKAFDDAYASLNLPEGNPQEILARGVAAAKMSGLYKEERTGNPVFRGIFGGGAPNLKPTNTDGDDADNVLNTDKGKSALGAMGVPADYGTKKE